MEKKLQVFISSTYTDLREERQAAVEAILSAGHIPAGMELFNAGNDTQLHTIKKWIDESDVYLLILGARYGSIEPASEVSYTEIEYNYAVDSGKPVFAVYISEVFSEAKCKKKMHETDVKKAVKLQEFRDLVLSRMCRPFDDCKDIKISIHETMGKYVREFPDLSGWIAGHLVSNHHELIKENLLLRSKVSELENKLLQQAARVGQEKAASEQRMIGKFSFEDLNKLLSDIEMPLPETIFPGSKGKLNLRVIFYSYQNAFTNGIDNDAFSQGQHKYLYVNCAPRLATFGLVEKDKRSKTDRYITSQAGLDYLAFIQRAIYNEKIKKEQAGPLSNKK